MSRRDNAALRCKQCSMHNSLCICKDMPSIDVATKLCLVLHHREAKKPTNTGQLALRSLLGSELIIHGRENIETKAPWPSNAKDSFQSILLYPAEGAQVLHASHRANGPIRLIVPDGTWRQAAKMPKRIPWMQTLPCVTLPPAQSTSYRLRHEPKVHGLATMEAIARAFGILEGPQVQEKLEDIFRKMIDRTLFSRGQLNRAQVYGGIPEHIFAHLPGQV